MTPFNPSDQILPVTLLRGRLRKSTNRAAGYDLFSTVDILIPIGGTVSIPTGVVTTMRADIAAVIKDRSGLAKRDNLTTFAGLIDSDYDKEWEVILHNAGKYPFKVNVGDRIAQVIFVQRFDAVAIGEGVIETETTKREGGFGSTGV